jgi:hypothetical protein
MVVLDLRDKLRREVAVVHKQSFGRSGGLDIPVARQGAKLQSGA